MTAREKRLLGLLGWAALLAACVLIAASGMERLREASSSIDRYRSQLARVDARASEDPAVLEARIRDLEDAVGELEDRGRGAGKDMDLADFGAAVRRSLQKSGAAVLRYQPVQAAKEAPPNLLEFSARGSPLALSRFLLEAANEGWGIPFLSVRSESAEVPVEFIVRIGHGY